MKDLILFLKEIFMMKQEDNIKVGLSQIKTLTPVEKHAKKAIAPQKTEVKLSELMRRSY